MLPKPSIEYTLQKLCTRPSPRHVCLHGFMHRVGVDIDTLIGNFLVSPWIEAGRILDAQCVFDKMTCPNESSWNVLISGYLRSGNPDLVLDIYEHMWKGGSMHPSGKTFVLLCKACAALRDLQTGIAVYAEALRLGYFQSNRFVQSAMLDMFVKCGALSTAQEAFDMLPVRDCISWTTLMGGYIENGQFKEALTCIEYMQCDRIPPDACTFVCILKLYGCIGAIDRARDLHAEIERLGMVEKNLFVASTLVDVYAKCGLLYKAQHVFDRLSHRNIVSWNALVAGHAEHGNGEEAIKCYEKMQLDGVIPNEASFVCTLKACGCVRALEKGREIHGEVERHGLLEADVAIGNSVVDMYAKCGVLAQAQQVFDGLRTRDVVSWTALISGCVEHGQMEEALKAYEQMQYEGVYPNIATFICILKACTSEGAFVRGCEMHVKIESRDLQERDGTIGNALVSMYSKCGAFGLAKQVLDKLLVRGVVPWTALMVGYVEHGNGHKALECFTRMKEHGIWPNSVTYTYALKACSSVGAIEKGGEIHEEINGQGLVDSNLDLANALIDMYAKFGLLVKAQNMFDKLHVPDIVSWGTLVGGYAEHGHYEEVLNSVERMQLEGVALSAVIYACGLKACGSACAVDKGMVLHIELERHGLLDRNCVLGNSLVDMYNKFGDVSRAKQVFERLPARDIISWNAFIGGYGGLGKSEVLSMVDRMRRDGFEPDSVTFVVLLSTCGLMGLFNRSQTYFKAMSKDFGIAPALEHHMWMVDLLGRSGQIDMVGAMTEEMPFVPTHAMWHLILRSCCNSGSLDLGEEAFQHAMVSEGMGALVVS